MAFLLLFVFAINIFIQIEALPTELTGSSKTSNCSLLSLPVILRDPFISIDDLYERMTCLDQYFLAQHDYMLHFNNIYLQMTRLAREKLATGTYFELPEWMEHYIYHFGNFYREALLNYITGNIEKVPRSWQLAFEHSRKGDMTYYINFAIGMTAHIVRDLGVAASEVDPAGVNATAKKSDSQKVNAIIYDCSRDLETALVKFYAPVINMTNWKAPIHVVLDSVTDVLRHVAWEDAMFMATHPTEKDTKIHMMDEHALVIERVLADIAPLFKKLKQYEQLFPFEHFCQVVPWGC